MIRDLEGTYLKKKCEEEVYGQVSLNGQKCEDICVSCEHYLRVTWAGEDLNNQVNRTTCSVASSQPLFLDTWPLPKRLTNRGHCGGNGGYPWAQQHGLLLTKDNLATTNIECPICQQKRSMVRAPIWCCSPKCSASDMVAGWVHQTVDIMGRTDFQSYWNKHLF